MDRRLIPPVRGAADFNASADTPPDAFPPHAGRNFRLRTGTGQRLRPGKRPGIAKQFASAAGGGEQVQLLDVIAKAAGTTYAVGTSTPIDGGASVKAEGLLGQAWFLDANRAMFRAFRDDYPNPSTGLPGNYGAFVCSWHPGGTTAAIGTIVAKEYNWTHDDGVASPSTGTRVLTNITLFNPDTNAVVWETEIEDKDAGGAVQFDSHFHRHLIANSVRVYATFTYVFVGPYVYVLRTSDGVYLKRHALGNVPWECMDGRVRPDNTLAVLYWGNPVVSGPVTGDSYAEGSYFRSGIALFGISTDTTVGGTPLTEAQFGVKKTDPWTVDANNLYEDHIHFRFAEHSLASPRGCMPQGLGMASDGALWVGRSNQGFGPTDAYPPDSVVSPPITLCRVTAGTTTAAMDVEVDTDSAQANWQATGWWNDIGVDVDGAPIGSPPAGPESSIIAVAVSQTTGDVFAAGKRVNGFCVYCLRDDGVIKWKADLGGTIYQHCIAVDPVTGLVAVTGQRNSSWTGAGGAQAHLWWLDPQSGDVRFHYDLDEATGSDASTAVSGFSIDISSTGRIVYTTTHIG